MSEREVKREQFSEQEKSDSIKYLPVIIVLFAVIAAGGWFMFGAQSAGGPNIVNAEQDGKLYFSAAEYDDGVAKYYRYNGKNGPINFFLVKSHDGVIRSALNACDVCYKAQKGYRQEGNEMVCNNCDMRFRTDKINVLNGGCNPAPLKRQQVGDQVIITAADIEKGSWYFKGFK